MIIDWAAEPQIQTVSVQVGEMPRAYRATWEIRAGYSNLVALEIREGDTDNPWRTLSRYRRYDVAVAAVLSAGGATALEPFGLKVDVVGPEHFSA